MLGAAENYRGTSSRVDPLMCFVVVLFRTKVRFGVIIQIRIIAYTYIMHACCRIAWRAARAWSRALLVRSGPSNNYTSLLLQAAMSSQLVPVGNDPGKSWKYPAVSGSGEPQCEYCGYIKGCVCFVEARRGGFGWMLPNGWYSATSPQVHQFFREIWPRRSARLQRKGLLSAKPVIQK